MIGDDDALAFTDAAQFDVAFAVLGRLYSVGLVQLAGRPRDSADRPDGLVGQIFPAGGQEGLKPVDPGHAAFKAKSGRSRRKCGE